MKQNNGSYDDLKLEQKEVTSRFTVDLNTDIESQATTICQNKFRQAPPFSLKLLNREAKLSFITEPAHDKLTKCHVRPAKSDLPGHPHEKSLGP